MINFKFRGNFVTCGELGFGTPASSVVILADCVQSFSIHFTIGVAQFCRTNNKVILTEHSFSNLSTTTLGKENYSRTWYGALPLFTLVSIEVFLIWSRNIVVFQFKYSIIYTSVVMENYFHLRAQMCLIKRISDLRSK